MKIITHLDLSQESRYQAMQKMPRGKMVIVFGSSVHEVITKALREVVSIIYKR